jgi:hypothetical protein
LSKDREMRYASAAELARDLVPFAPERARGAVERAASMVPAFAVKRGTSAPPGLAPSQQTLDTQSEMHRVDPLSASAPRVSTHSGLGGQSITPTPLAMSAPPPSPTIDDEVAQLRRPKRLVLATWAVAALVVVALIVTLRRKPQPQVAAALPPPAPTEAPPPDPDANTIDLVVRVSPPSAQITIDGASVSSNPFHGRFPKDQTIHQIRAAAVGFDPKWEDVPLMHDVVVDMSLDRHAPTAAGARASSVAPVARPAAPAAPAPRPVAAPRAVKRIAATPPPSSSPAPIKEAPAPSLAEVSPTGGRPPLRPIETKNPYGSP